MNSGVAVFWDYENCRHTANLSGAHLVEKLRSLVEDFGTIKSFKAYADLSLEYANAKAANFYCELQSSGVSLIHCPHNGGKDVADKMLLVDMFAFAIDNPPPATIVLITGDRDFAYAVSILKLRGYKVAVVVPPVCAHASLKAQASILFDWQKDVLAVPAGYHSRNSSTVFSTSTQSSIGAQATSGLGFSVSGGSVSIAETQLKDYRAVRPPLSSDDKVQTEDVDIRTKLQVDFQASDSQMRVEQALQISSTLCMSTASGDMHCPSEQGQNSSSPVKSVLPERLDERAASHDSIVNPQTPGSSPHSLNTNHHVLEDGDKGKGLQGDIQHALTDHSTHASDLQQTMQPTSSDIMIESAMPSVGAGPFLLSPRIPYDVDLSEEKEASGKSECDFESTTSSTQEGSFTPSDSMSEESLPSSVSEESPIHNRYDVRFKVLVDVLRGKEPTSGGSGIASSDIAPELRKVDPHVYAKAGVSNFKKYIAKARQARILVDGKFDVYGGTLLKLNPTLYFEGLSSSVPTQSSPSSPSVIHEPILTLLQPGKKMLFSKFGEELRQQYPDIHKLVRAKGFKWHINEAAKAGLIQVGKADKQGQEWFQRKS